VIRFDNRPFTSVEEMDETLIQRWNAKVGKGDLVYVLGDLIWKSRNGDAHNLIKSLNGQIILIKGNHDRFLHNAKAKETLAGIKDYEDICVTLEDGSVRRCILSHYFMPMYNGHWHQAIHLHGHSHFTAESKIELRIAKELNDEGFANEIYNVGCMYWNYEPVTLDEVLRHEESKHGCSKVEIEFKINAELYDEVGIILKQYGLTHEEAILLFLKETVRLGRIPFEYTWEDLAEAQKLSREVDVNGK
jgi:Predicted phosphoesterase or phosphohydrolase